MSVPQQSSSLNPSAPQTTHSLKLNYSPSIISSRVTDIVSEDGDEYYPEGAVAAAAQSKARVLAESQHYPNRPASPQRDIWHQLPSSRRGIPPITTWGGWRPSNAFGGSGVTMTNTSRPQSANSRSSRTHASSMTSNAFFRPMSSQRLQAQRGRSHILDHTNTIGAPPSSFGSGINRESLGSNHTWQNGYQENEVLPPSRDTEFTEQNLRDRTPAKDNATAQSVDESTRSLYKYSSHQKLNHIRGFTGNAVEQNSSDLYISTFPLPSSSPSNPVQSTSNPNRHSSNTTSPKPGPDIPLNRREADSGRNYEFFPGNTIFCCGGRFQNTRERPINFGTGVLVILPAVLFFIYS